MTSDKCLLAKIVFGPSETGPPKGIHNKRRFEKARSVHFARFVVLDAPYGFDFSNPCNVRPLIDDYYSFTDLSVLVFREIKVTHR